MSNEAISGLVASIFTIRDVVHICHLNSNNFDEHKILDDFYKEIIDMGDRIFESAKGIDDSFSFDSLPELKVTLSALNYITAFQRFVQEIQADLGEDYSSISSIVDEVVELSSSTIYKLGML